MTPRELNNELQRLKQLAKSLLSAIEALQTRAEVVPTDDRTVPPPARPTTRIRRVGPTKSLSTQMQAQDDEPPSTRPGAAGGSTYRHVAKKR